MIVLTTAVLIYTNIYIYMHTYRYIHTHIRLHICEPLSVCVCVVLVCVQRVRALGNTVVATRSFQSGFEGVRKLDQPDLPHLLGITSLALGKKAVPLEKGRSLGDSECKSSAWPHGAHAQLAASSASGAGSSRTTTCQQAKAPLKPKALTQYGSACKRWKRWEARLCLAAQREACS